MTFRRLLIASLALLHLTACPQAGQFVGPGSFNADKTSSGDEKSGGGDKTADATDGSSSPFFIREGAPPPDGTGPDAKSPSLPQGGDAGGQTAGSQQPTSGMYMRSNNPIVAGGPGPIFPGPDGQDVEKGKPRTRLRTGENFSQIITTSENDVKIPLSDGEPVDLKLLLEDPIERNDGSHDFDWVASVDGPQVRLVLRPAGKECDQFQDIKYADAVVAMTADGSNVNFKGLHAKPGIALFTLYKIHPAVVQGINWLPPDESIFETTPDFNGGDFIAFPSRAACEASSINNGGNSAAWLGVLTYFALPNNPTTLAQPAKILF